MIGNFELAVHERFFFFCIIESQFSRLYQFVEVLKDGSRISKNPRVSSRLSFRIDFWKSRVIFKRVWRIFQWRIWREVAFWNARLILLNGSWIHWFFKNLRDRSNGNVKEDLKLQNWSEIRKQKNKERKQEKRRRRRGKQWEREEREKPKKESREWKKSQVIEEESGRSGRSGWSQERKKWSCH